MGLFKNVKMIDLRISGMSCDGCRERVTGALERVDGVQKAKVDLDRGYAEVSLDPASETGPDELVQAVREAGYDAEPPSAE